jgi:8-oxo-dGTP pyrophosphatase MutT (NUDIX family)
MPISEYLRGLRERVGTDLLLVPSVTALIFDELGRVLLVKHSNRGLWVAPGGSVDPDESPADAIVREVWEETGLRVQPVRLCGVYGGPEFRMLYENDDEVAYVMATFECRIVGGEMVPDGEEVLEARYVAAGELEQLNLAEWARVVLPTLVAGRGEPWIMPVTWQPPPPKP